MEQPRAIIAPSILSADFGRLAEQIGAVEAAGADWIHCDVMDGHYVPNITIGPLIVDAARQATELPLDVHLMIENPSRYVEDFIKAGADIITVHAEACVHLHRDIQNIRELSNKHGRAVRAAVSLNPHTPLSILTHVLEDLDMVLLMSVNPGFGGQKFIRSCLPKLRSLRSMVVQQGLSLDIEVDGGITVENAAEVWAAGGNAFVAGTTIFKSPDYKKTITALRSKMQG